MSVIPHFDYQTFGSQIFWLVATFVLFYLFISGVFIPMIHNITKRRSDYLQTIKENLSSSIQEKDELQISYQTIIDDRLLAINKILNEERNKEKIKIHDLYGELISELHHYMELMENNLQHEFNINKEKYDYIAYLLIDTSLPIMINDN